MDNTPPNTPQETIEWVNGQMAEIEATSHRILRLQIRKYRWVAMAWLVAGWGMGLIAGYLFASL